jgi:hypothetical protein
MLGAAAAASALDAAASRCTGRVPGKHVAQVPFAEDQHSVGYLGPDGQHNALGESVRPETPRRIFTTSMPASARTASERWRELSGPITDEEPEPGGVFTDVYDEVAGLLVVQGPSRIGWPKGVSPCGSHRSWRDRLRSPGSCHPGQ